MYLGGGSLAGAGVEEDVEMLLVKLVRITSVVLLDLVTVLSPWREKLGRYNISSLWNRFQHLSNSTVVK